MQSLGQRPLCRPSADHLLIGFPIRVTVGKRGLSEGIVEVQTRRTGELQKLRPEDVAPSVAELVRTMIQAERT